MLYTPSYIVPLIPQMGRIHSQMGRVDPNGLLKLPLLIVRIKREKVSQSLLLNSRPTVSQTVYQPSWSHAQAQTGLALPPLLALGD